MSNANLFEVIILDLDGGVASQKRLLSQYDATVIPLREKVADVFFWCNKKVMDELIRLVAASCRTTKPKVIFLGSAVNHHPYIGLSMIKEPVTVICFDNHSEFWREKLTKFSSFPFRDYWNREYIHHCGSWVIRVLKLPNIKKVVLFGVDGDFGINKFMFYPKGMWSHAFDLLLNGTVEIYTNKMRQSVQVGRISGSLPCVEFKPGIFTTTAIWKNMSDNGGVQATVERVVSKIPTESVYITIDKDVLSGKESFTAPPGYIGEMTLDELLNGLSFISKTKRVLGVDICGDAPLHDAVTDIQKSNADFIRKYMARYDKVFMKELLSPANIKLNESVNLKIMERLNQMEETSMQARNLQVAATILGAQKGKDRAIVALTRQDSIAIAEVLADSFRLDPAFQYTFRSTTDGRDTHYRRLIDAWVKWALGEKHILLGMYAGGTLAAVVGVAGLDGRASRWSISRDLPAMLGVLPGVRLGRALALAMVERRPRQVPTPSAEISMLAVHPRCQGQGLASKLLSRAHEVVAEALPSAGVYLLTTHPGSRLFYAKQGYELLTHKRIGSVDIFHLLNSRI